MEDEDLSIYYGYYENDFTKEVRFYIKTRETSAGGVGKTTSRMKAKSTYGGEFDTGWQIEGGVSYPTLRQQK